MAKPISNNPFTLKVNAQHLRLTGSVGYRGQISRIEVTAFKNSYTMFQVLRSGDAWEFEEPTIRCLRIARILMRGSDEVKFPRDSESFAVMKRATRLTQITGSPSELGYLLIMRLMSGVLMTSWLGGVFNGDILLTPEDSGHLGDSIAKMCHFSREHFET